MMEFGSLPFDLECDFNRSRAVCPSVSRPHRRRASERVSKEGSNMKVTQKSHKPKILREKPRERIVFWALPRSIPVVSQLASTFDGDGDPICVFV